MGTPVLAARGRTIAAVVDHFRGGGARRIWLLGLISWPYGTLTVPMRDIITSRKKDLCIRSANESEEANKLLGLVTRGYTGGPHLHFDLVNLLTGGNVYAAHRLAERMPETLQSVAAAFSCELPSTPLRCKVVHVPNDAVSGDGLPIEGPWIALSDQGPGVDLRRENIISGRAGRVCGHHLEQPIRSRALCHGWVRTASPVPACLISKEHGIMLKSYLAGGNCVVLEFGRHPAVEGESRWLRS